MPDIERFKECQSEIGPISLGLRMSASFWEDETGTVPAENVVSATEEWYVKVCWDLTGRIQHHICGKWLLKLDLESIGDAKNVSSGCVEIEMDPCRDEPYCYTFKLDPNKVEPDECGTVYLVAVTLSSVDPCGHRGFIWGFCRGPSVMFVP